MLKEDTDRRSSSSRMSFAALVPRQNTRRPDASVSSRAVRSPHLAFSHLSTTIRHAAKSVHDYERCAPLPRLGAAAAFHARDRRVRASEDEPDQAGQGIGESSIPLCTLTFLSSEETHNAAGVEIS